MKVIKNVIQVVPSIGQIVFNAHIDVVVSHHIRFLILPHVVHALRDDVKVLLLVICANPRNCSLRQLLDLLLITPPVTYCDWL